MLYSGFDRPRAGEVRTALRDAEITGGVRFRRYWLTVRGGVVGWLAATVLGVGLARGLLF